MSILRKKQLTYERYTCGKIGAHGIQIGGEVGAQVLRFWTLVIEAKCLGFLDIKNTKKHSKYTIIYIYGGFRQLLTSVCTLPSSIWLPLRECLLSPKRTLRECFQIFLRLS